MMTALWWNQMIIVVTVAVMLFNLFQKTVKLNANHNIVNHRYNRQNRQHRVVEMSSRTSMEFYNIKVEQPAGYLLHQGYEEIGG